MEVEQSLLATTLPQTYGPSRSGSLRRRLAHPNDGDAVGWSDGAADGDELAGAADGVELAGAADGAGVSQPLQRKTQSCRTAGFRQ